MSVCRSDVETQREGVLRPRIPAEILCAMNRRLGRLLEQCAFVTLPEPAIMTACGGADDHFRLTGAMILRTPRQA
jgi:hypothetical protein